MPNTLSKVPIDYKAADIQRADLSLHLDIEEGLDEIADYRGGDRPLLGADGQFEGNRRGDVRRIVLRGWIRAADSSGYRTLVKELHTIFDPKVPGDLVATLEDGTTGTIRARADAIAWIDNERIGEQRGLRVHLSSIAPDWTYT